MAKQMLRPKDIKALRVALTQPQDEPTAEETAKAVQSLVPRISHAALGLAEKRAERRSIRLQALGLGACSVVFVGLAALGWQYREFLLAKPERWGVLAGLGVLIVVVAECLPLMVTKLEGEWYYETQSK